MNLNFYVVFHGKHSSELFTITTEVMGRMKVFECPHVPLYFQIHRLFASHIIDTPSLFVEQYDAFVKFTHDQIMRRYGEQPASCKYLTFEL